MRALRRAFFASCTVLPVLAGTTFGATSTSVLGACASTGEREAFEEEKPDASDTPSGDFAPDPLPQCATSSIPPEPLPVALVILFDRSQSMDEGGKWGACTEALKAFFASSKTKGISASLDFFPASADACDIEVYKQPTVSLRPLPDKTAFAEHVDAVSPKGETPTVPAMTGTIAYAEQIRKEVSAETRVAMVLVTDGTPNGCSSTAQSAKELLATASATIPTYVIGIGEVDDLDGLASAGGTGRAVRVSTTDPKVTREKFADALLRLQNAALACEYTIPPPPDGETLDPTKVNVRHLDAKGKATVLEHDPECSTGEGWRYDDETTPTRVFLCGAACGDLRLKGGTMELYFGCEITAVSK